MELARRVGTAAVALALAAAPAAAQIAYTTSGAFGGACSGTTCTVGGISIAYNSASGTNVTPPSFISFGTFQTTGSTPSGTFSVPFTLTINQTQPSMGGGSFSAGTLSGSLTFNSSQATFVAVSGEQVQIGTSTYSWFNTTYALVPPSVNAGAGNGVTTLQGQVAGSVVPEPASLFLLGTGLLGLGGLRRRRKQQS